MPTVVCLNFHVLKDVPKTGSKKIAPTFFSFRFYIFIYVIKNHPLTNVNTLCLSINVDEIYIMIVNSSLLYWLVNEQNDFDP